ncbi:DUF928 domain-containing protein [Laspinema sp. D1]|uniref:DUF928 domain-containing protein n=1 Tax=Laspinema palackyanum D2a TaxID=2953684 RepID=A0ABT2MWV6_9CYAN|nr:DUF928 domain-containing protein [Laspinema sp. D2a]
MKTKSLLFHKTIGFSLIPALILLLSLPMNVLSNQKGEQQNFEDEEPISDVVDAGSRGICRVESSENLRLTALAPSVQIGETLKSQPSFWFYSPYSLEHQITARFNMLKEDDKNFIDPIEIALPKTPGFFKVSIPQKYILDKNLDYNWYLSVICNPQDESQNIVLQGWIHRIQENDLLDDDYLLWYDQVDSLAVERCEDNTNEDLKQKWETLLYSVADQLDENRRNYWNNVIDQPMNCPGI